MDPHMGLGFLGMLISFGMCVLVPLGLISAWVFVATKRARARHEERMAMIAQGLVPPGDVTNHNWVDRRHARMSMRRDPVRGLGWAVGLIVCGVLWIAGVQHFAAILIGAGAAFLTRGIMGLRRDAAGPSGRDVPPGEQP